MTTTARFLASGVRPVLCGVFQIAVLTGVAFGQAREVDSNEWSRGTTLSGFVGAVVPSSDADAIAGLGFGWEIAPHFTLEGQGTWFRPGHGAKAYSASMNVLVPLVRAKVLVPFVSAGIGLHRATFAATSEMPEFYRRRRPDPPAATRGRSFDDLMLEFGAGTDLFVTSHLALRPDVNVRVIAAQSDVWAMPVYGLHLAYHFETHDVLNERPQSRR
jgi:hypothetical protein